MSLEWLSWLGNLVKLVGDLIPQREKIAPTHCGVKFKNMTNAIVLGPGRHWYWPWMSEIVTLACRQQTLHLSGQTLTTLDGRTVKVQGMITYSISTKEEDILKAMVECWNIEDSIDDEGEAVFCDFITKTTFDDIQKDRQEVNKQLTSLVRRRLREYGVRVKRAQLTTYAAGLPLLHIGKPAWGDAE